MQASAAAEAAPGVERALVAMGTDLNRSLLAGLGFTVPEGLGPDDLVLAIRAGDPAAADQALAAAGAALAAAPAPTGGGFEVPSPRRAGAVAQANLALISVPGPYAFVEAMDALRAGMSVMLFSDNVPLPQEIALKQEAIRRGLLVMGPGAGTALVHGVGLGFANAVRPGPVGIVGASGTGIQQLCCLLDDAGVGVRHALGTGSRDLHDEVGGASTLAAIDALAADPEVEVIAVVSKPPGPEAAEQVRAAAAGCGKPAAVAFMGEVTLEEAAREVLGLLGRPILQAYTDWAIVDGPHRPGHLLGLFSGGTLRDEARAVAGAVLREIATEAGAAGHAMLDLGDEEYTRGRPHPMIDHRTRLDFLAQAAADASVGVVLLDVVLGYGAHPDPAGALAPAVANLTTAGAAAVVSLCGTAADPQGRERQAAAIAEAGASVLLSNAAAARLAARLAGERP
ncbi:MAG: FdrA family protein [Acidimicrobiia bacterium]|nr:FdrA family protein [Acidimicrobiia bacterium]